MESQDKARGHQESPKRDGATKKPYRKPTFRSEQVFETMALSCGKVDVTQQQCRFNRKAS
jgi:hypothetical protein